MRLCTRVKTCRNRCEINGASRTFNIYIYSKRKYHRYCNGVKTGVFASKYDFGISNVGCETARGPLSPHVPNVRVHSHVSLFSRKFWASKVLYRGSAADF